MPLLRQDQHHTTPAKLTKNDHNTNKNMAHKCNKTGFTLQCTYGKFEHSKGECDLLATIGLQLIDLLTVNVSLLPRIGIMRSDP